MSKSLFRAVLIVLCVMLICSGVRLTACAQDRTSASQVTRTNNTQTAIGAATRTPAPKADATAANSQTNFAPLTADQKMKRAFKHAFFSPAPYAFTAVDAAITEATERHQPQKDTADRFADGLSRFAIIFATSSTNTLLGSGVYPSILKQDPRYYPSHKHGFGPRTAYALSRVFVTRGDNGQAQPNYSWLGGSLSASALANIWERNTPGHRRIGVAPTFTRFGTSVGFRMLENVVLEEFWPDIKKKLGHK